MPSLRALMIPFTLWERGVNELVARWISLVGMERVDIRRGKEVRGGAPRYNEPQCTVPNTYHSYDKIGLVGTQLRHTKKSHCDGKALVLNSSGRFWNRAPCPHIKSPCRNENKRQTNEFKEEKAILESI